MEDKDTSAQFTATRLRMEMILLASCNSRRFADCSSNPTGKLLQPWFRSLVTHIRGYAKSLPNIRQVITNLSLTQTALDGHSLLMNNTVYILAVEKLCPPRAHIRVIISELARISSHLLAVGALGLDIGAVTVFMWTFRERENYMTSSKT